MSKNCTLILGGARSGKSSFAQHLASKTGSKVLFIATASPLDEEMRQRIEMHRKKRPKNWRTMEVPLDVGKKIEGAVDDADVVILDCITLLINNVFEKCRGEKARVEILEKEVSTEIKELLKCIARVDANFTIVSNDVGMGIVPANKTARIYRDILGKTNQELVKHSDTVYFMIAGVPIQIKPSLGLDNQNR